jgi:hypothetical protein
LDLITAYFLKSDQGLAPANQRVRVIAFADPQGGETPPGNPTLLVDRMVNTTGLRTGDAFLSLSLSNPKPRLTAGKIYVGYVFPANAERNGFSISMGHSVFGDKTFISRDGGATWQGLNVPGFTAGIFAHFEFPLQ